MARSAATAIAALAENMGITPSPHMAAKDGVAVF